MIDYYGLGTPNGQKISIALEELKIAYNSIHIDIMKGEQFTEDFKKINPNSKIPAIVDNNGPDGKPLALFESGAILLYLAERYDQNGEFLPKDPVKRYQTIQWLMFQMAGVGPMFGQMGHFHKYAPEKIPYAMNRYEKEAIRIFGVLDHQLATNKYVAGDTYTIADMAIYPWVIGVDKFYHKLQDMGDVPNVKRWLKDIEQREAVQKGMKVLEFN